uniref:Uncharacterized protein n=1 Tax=Oryza barthii TaxID=65489 RepID=A0A0D3HLR9_9ORYZ
MNVPTLECVALGKCSRPLKIKSVRRNQAEKHCSRASSLVSNRKKIWDSRSLSTHGLAPVTAQQRHHYITSILARMDYTIDASSPTPLTAGSSAASPILSGIASPLTLSLSLSMQIRSPLPRRRAKISVMSSSRQRQPTRHIGCNLAGSDRDLGEQVNRWRGPCTTGASDSCQWLEGKKNNMRHDSQSEWKDRMGKQSEKKEKESSKPEVEEFGSISLLPARTRIMDPDSVGLAKHQDWSFITHTFVFYCSALLSLGLSLSRTYKHTKTPF